MMQKDTITKVTENTLLIRSDSGNGGVAFIYKNPNNHNKVFMTGDFTLEELQEVIAEYKQHNNIVEDSFYKKLFNKFFN